MHERNYMKWKLSGYKRAYHILKCILAIASFYEPDNWLSFPNCRLYVWYLKLTSINLIFVAVKLLKRPALLVTGCKNGKRKTQKLRMKRWVKPLFWKRKGPCFWILFIKILLLTPLKIGKLKYFRFLVFVINFCLLCWWWLNHFVACKSY